MATEPKKKTVPGIRVKAKTDGFRRGGRAWSTQPIDVAIAAFSKEQIKQIRACPMLAVSDVEITPADAE